MNGHALKVAVPASAAPVERARRVWPFALAAAFPLAVDVAFPSWVTGLLATLAMGTLATLGWRSLRGVRAARRAQVALLLGMTGFLLARMLILYRQLGGGAGEAGHAAQSYDLAFFGLEGTRILTRVAQRRVQKLAVLLTERPALLLTASFVGLIIVASFLLSMPFAVHRTADISLLDALFTITSGVCVTGLAVNDVGAVYTLFGQAVLLLSIQLGGIGIMTISALALSMTTGLETQARYAAMLDARSFVDMRALVRSVLYFTLAIEALGALLLLVLWWDDPNVAARGGAAWNALFHSVSAFCNAGFSLLPTNMMVFVGDASVQVVIMLLIVLGGIGFPVLRELTVRGRALYRRWRRGEIDPTRLSLASRVALAVSAALIVGGAVLFALLESGQLFLTLSTGERVLSALFSSVTARTAGFNTIDFGALLPSTLLLIMVLMFIGGSPGSCAGGIKTTTAAVLASSLAAELRGQEPRLGARALAPSTLRRAIAVTTISGVVVLVSLLLLTLTERHGFLQLAFEAVSAYATVGLSTGITPALSSAGKLVIIVTMFVGRVGPMTVALAIAESRERALHRLAPEDLPIG